MSKDLEPANVLMKDKCDFRRTSESWRRAEEESCGCLSGFLFPSLFLSRLFSSLLVKQADGEAGPKRLKERRRCLVCSSQNIKRSSPFKKNLSGEKVVNRGMQMRVWRGGWGSAGGGGRGMSVCLLIRMFLFQYWEAERERERTEEAGQLSKEAGLSGRWSSTGGTIGKKYGGGIRTLSELRLT